MDDLSELLLRVVGDAHLRHLPGWVVLDPLVALGVLARCIERTLLAKRKRRENNERIIC